MKIARIFFDVDMRCNFEGLRQTLLEAKVDVEALTDYVVIFMNRKTTCFKMLVDNDYIVYFKNGNRRIPLDAIQYLPTRFGGSEMEFNRAVEKSLREKLGGHIAKHKIIRRPASEARA